MHLRWLAGVVRVQAVPLIVRTSMCIRSASKFICRPGGTPRRIGGPGVGLARLAWGLGSQCTCGLAGAMGAHVQAKVGGWLGALDVLWCAGSVRACVTAQGLRSNAPTGFRVHNELRVEETCGSHGLRAQPKARESPLADCIIVYGFEPK